MGISRFIKHEHSSPNGVRVSADGTLVVVRVEDADRAIPVWFTSEQARELARVIEAFAVVVDSQESEVMS